MDNPYEVSVSRVIPAPPAEIFAVISNTEGHVAIDGSGTVKEAIEPRQLELGGYPEKHPPNMEATLERLEAEVLRRREAAESTASPEETEDPED